MAVSPLFHPRAREVTTVLNDARGQLDAAIENAPRAIRDTHTPSVEWSVSGILEHLLLTEGPIEHYLSTHWIGTVRAGALMLEEETASVVPSFDRRWHRLELSTHRGALRPAGIVTTDTARSELRRIRKRLLNVLCEVDGFAWADAH